MPARISLQIEIPEELHQTLQRFLESRDHWDRDRLFQASLALFLLQNGMNDRKTSRFYLDALFRPDSLETIEALSA